MVLAVHLRHELLDIMILKLVNSITHDTASAGIALSDESDLVCLSRHVDARRSVRGHCAHVVHVVMHVARVEVVLLDVSCILGPREEILTTFLVIKNFYEELGIKLKSAGHI